MAIRTALTEALGLEYPIVLAPMASVSGGRLAAAVSNAGGLGLVGGGYGDHVWLRDELSVAKAETVRPWGVGLITWATTHETVQLALSYEPHTFMFSFGDPRPHVPAIKEAGCKLICQVQGLEGARQRRRAPTSSSLRERRLVDTVPRVPRYRWCLQWWTRWRLHRS